MKTSQGRTDWIMLGLYVFICLLVKYTLGEIEIEMDRTPEDGEEMVLTCTYNWPVDGDWMKFRKTSIMWKYSFEDNQGLHERTLETSYQYHIEVDQKRDALISQLTIYRLDDLTYGKYTCKNKRTGDMATVDLRTLPDEGNIIGFFGAVIVVITLLLLVVTSVVVGICKFKKYSSRRPEHRRNSHSSVQTQDSDVAELDLPPRYSLVVVSPDDTFGLDDSCMSPGVAGDQDPCTLHTPPPNYAQAILDLANKGLLLNIDSLRPLPPSYTDIAHLPQNSRQIV